MSPLTHLVGSWLVAVATTNNVQDRKLVTWAGVLPDADGLGVIPDVVGSWISGKECTYYYYQQYHHLLFHGWPAAIVVSILFALYAQQRRRVLLLCLLTFHLHLLCDLIGSRGPTPGDLWPICYSEPLFRHPIWFWNTNGNWTGGKIKPSSSSYFWQRFGWRLNEAIRLLKLSIHAWIRFSSACSRSGLDNFGSRTANLEAKFGLQF